MNTSKALFLGLSLIAGAVLITYVNAGSADDAGKFTLSSSDGIAYRLNTDTGAISVCVRGMTMEEKVGCTPWSK